jgi:hypothetical protein
MRALRYIAVIPVVFYKYVISPFLAPSCRFEPSCSAYAKDAILTHGVIKGSFLAFKRVCKCQPWGKSGHDPVPMAKKD